MCKAFEHKGQKELGKKTSVLEIKIKHNERSEMGWKQMQKRCLMNLKACNTVIGVIKIKQYHTTYHRVKANLSIEPPLTGILGIVEALYFPAITMFRKLCWNNETYKIQPRLQLLS